ncbi:hypothetical protein CR513_39235, partial [Mucuna pruriens]
MLFGHTELHTELRWGCLPTGLYSVKPATFLWKLNTKLTGLSNKLEELRLEAYENSWIYKQKVKKFHDQQILRKEFRVDQKVLLFNLCLKLIASKLRSRWDGPFVITNVFPYGAVVLKDEYTNNTFQVNGHQIKLFHEGPTPTTGNVETISLMEPAPLDSAH